MAALASDWLRHFRLLRWNHWTEFNETWQEARSQCPLPSLCFSGRSEKQDGRPGLWLAETFSTSPLKPLNGVQRNLIGSKISTSSTKFVFFGPIGKQKCSPWLIPQNGGRLYSGARYVALWASCYQIWVSQRKRGKKTSWRSVFFYRNLASVCTIRSVSNAQKLQFKTKKSCQTTSLINNNIRNFYALIMHDDHDIDQTRFRVCKKKKKKRFSDLPTRIFWGM